MGRRVQHVCGVRNDVPRGDLRLTERRAKTVDALGANRRLVAVVLRNRGEDLQGLHPRAAGPAHGHVDAAVIDRVGSEVERHSAPSVEVECRAEREWRVTSSSRCLQPLPRLSTVYSPLSSGLERSSILEPSTYSTVCGFRSLAMRFTTSPMRFACSRMMSACSF